MKPFGLLNRYSNCYYNSIMQIILRTPLFERRFIEASSKDPIVNWLIKFYITCRQNVRGNVLDATPILPHLCRKFNLPLSSQHDSHELYIQMIDMFRGEDGVIMDEDVEYTFLESFHCIGCGYRFKKKSKETCLHLTVEDDISIGMGKYLGKEHLDDGYKCDKCGEKNRTMKSTCITKVPAILSIYIQRWRSGGMDTRRMDFKKFRLSSNVDKVYSPFGLICYSGNGNGGHYYCYVKMENGKWYEFNDSSAMPIYDDRHLSNVVYAFYE